MRVLGVDPGLTRCGIGVVDSLPGRRAALVAVGVVRSDPAATVDLRLRSIADQLDDWLDANVPDVLAVERVFADTNITTVMTTAHATAVALLTATKRGIPVVFHTPTEVKAAVTGSGRADKAQVTAMVTRILKLDAAPKPADAADAVAIAICHVWRGSTTNRYAAAVAAAKGKNQ